MQIELELNRSVDDNASGYYEKAKKARKKIDGVNKAIEIASKKLGTISDDELRLEEKKAEKSKKVDRKKEWYEAYRYFFTTNNFLVIAGRDANTNEQIIKSHLEKDDLVFHTDMPGSPFGILKTNGSEPTAIDIDETAQFIASYSKAWSRGLATSEIYYVNSDQVTKEAKAGEYMSKGSFMIYGKRNYLNPILKIVIANVDGVIVASTPSAIKNKTNNYVTLVQGSVKASTLAKDIRSLISGELDDIIRLIPSGGSKLVKR